MKRGGGGVARASTAGERIAWLTRRALVAVGFAVALAACAPPAVERRVESPGAPPGFPAADYRALAQRGAPVFVVDARASRALIEVGRAGRLARLGHEHAIVARDVHGYVAPSAGRADFYVRVDTLAVDEAGARREAGLDTQPSAADIAGTRENMLHKVFDVPGHPFVVIRARQVPADGVPSDVIIEVNGNARAVPVTMHRGGDATRFEATGRFSIDQSAFGIAPFSVLGGALQVRDRVDVRFSIEARADPGADQARATR